jgi:hypothetical protein
LNGRQWTAEEDEYLISNYPSETNKVITEKLNRNIGSIVSRAMKLGVTKSHDAYQKARRDTYKRKSQAVNNLNLECVSTDRAYMNEKWLRYNYYSEKHSANEMAEMTGVEVTTILRWMDHFGLERRTITEITDRTRTKISKIASEKRGDKTSRWNGGQAIRHGYRFILQPDHPNANALGYVQEHRLVMEFVLARLLERAEVVHHRDGNRLNNIIDNLFVFPNSSAHAKFHSYKKFVNPSISEEEYMETVYESKP